MWKNGVGTFLSDTYTMDIAYDITIAGGDIYIAGFSQNSGIATADLWKNGMITHLTNGTNYARAYSVAVADKKMADARRAASVTPAELRVLRYLPTKLTFALIAHKLGISRGAAKMRAERMYEKLDVHDRAQAVERARSLHVLP